jgi:integrase
VAEARRLLGVIAGERLEAFYVLALTTGLRRGELLTLRWDDRSGPWPGALGGTRTPNLLIRSKIRVVHGCPLVTAEPARGLVPGPPIPHASKLVQGRC